MLKKSVGVIGAGEVGMAIIQLLIDADYKVFAKDLNFDETQNQKVEFLHICIPFNKDFIKNATNEILRLKPTITIIHSTVAVGTTRKIFNKTNLPIVHSPIRGDHPHLAEHTKRFVKYIGPVEERFGNPAKKHLQDLGIRVEVFRSSEETELAKLLDTTYFGLTVLYAKFVSELCGKIGLDYEKVYTKYNQTYNQGYQEVGRPEVVRPVIKNMPGSLGGHCVIPNMEILSKGVNNKWTDFMLQQNNHFGKISPSSLRISKKGKTGKSRK